MVDGNLEKKIETPTAHTREMVNDFSFAAVISEVTGKLWDRSDKESSEDERDSIHAYLEARFVDWGGVESLVAAAI